MKLTEEDLMHAQGGAPRAYVEEDLTKHPEIFRQQKIREIQDLYDLRTKVVNGELSVKELSEIKAGLSRDALEEEIHKSSGKA